MTADCEAEAISRALLTLGDYAESFSASAESADDRYLRGAADAFRKAIELVEREANRSR